MKSILRTKSRMEERWLLATACAIFMLCMCNAVEGAKQRQYKMQEEVPLYMDTIGPFSNPSETYEYYSLPFCKPDAAELEKKKLTLGEKLEGHRMYNSLYEIRFGVPSQSKVLCEKQLDAGKIEQFKYAIKKYYFFEMEFDGLPLKGFVGTMNQVAFDSAGEPIVHHFLFEHLHFTFLYNKNQVIFGNVTADISKVVELDGKHDINVQFSYSVDWVPTDIEYKDRMTLYNDPYFRDELEIHWLSIVNSLILVVLLVGFIAVILMKVLKSDYARYRAMDEEADDAEDYGWKLVHGDVFRFPSSKNLFCAIFGVGVQLLAIAMSIALLTFIGFLYPSQTGSLYSAIVLLYVPTCAISGATSAAMYKKLQGEAWAWNIILTASLARYLRAVLGKVAASLIANAYHTTSAVPIGTMIQIMALWLFVGFPITVSGGIAGRRLAGPFEAPVRTKNFPREIPPIPWYRTAIPQFAMAGFLPFASIYVELYYVYASMWSRGSYTLYGVLFLVFVILLIVTACITIALTYFQLALEDHRWWWRSFLSGGSTSFFIFLYSLYFYYYRSNMSGLLQTVKYFGYVSIACYFFFCLLGAVGFYASLIFVRKMYGNLKCD